MDREVDGAVKAIAVHPTDPKILYIGAVNGGIWKTTNATDAEPKWQPQTDGAESLSIGALVFDPTDRSHQTLVAGIGRFSSYHAGGALTGLLRTTDGGATWPAITAGGKLRGLNISGVAPRGNAIVVSSDLGIFRVTNFNTDPTQISGSANSGLPPGISYDLASDPKDAARLFTNAGTAGIYRSTNTGATWKKVSNAAMERLLNDETHNVRIAVGVHNEVYVAIADGPLLDNGLCDCHVVGLFRSGNGGDSWIPLDLPHTTEQTGTVDINPGGQADLHLSLAADYTNPNVVYIGGDRQPPYDKTDSGETWPNSIAAETYSGRLFRVDASRRPGNQAAHITHSNTRSISAPHADSRNMAIALNGDILEVDDGGVYRRTKPLTNVGDWFSMNGNLEVTEFHAIAWDANSHTIIGGAQDTGTPEQDKADEARWESVDTGDGGDVVVDDSSTPGRSVRYSSADDLSNFRRRVFDASNKLQSDTSPHLRLLGNSDPLDPQFYTPLELNKVDATRLVLGGANGVYESLDQGETVREIGKKIRVNESGPIAYGGEDNPNMLYVGSGSQVFVRSNGAGASLLPLATYPAKKEIVGIALDPKDSKYAYVIDQTDVYRTVDAGKSLWTKVSGNLSQLNPVVLRSMAFVSALFGGSIAVGTNAGVFVASPPTFSVWSRLGSGLPNVPVFRLIYSAKDNKLLAGTLGRGAWTLDLKTQP